MHFEGGLWIHASRRNLGGAVGYNRQVEPSVVTVGYKRVRVRVDTIKANGSFLYYSSSRQFPEVNQEMGRVKGLKI